MENPNSPPSPPTEPPLATRLLEAAAALNMLADSDSRRLMPELVAGEQALRSILPVLLTEAASTLLGQGQQLRQLMDAYTAAGGGGVATLEAIEAAIKLGANPYTAAPAVEQTHRDIFGTPATVESLRESILALRLLRALGAVYTEATGNPVPSYEEMRAAMASGADPALEGPFAANMRALEKAYMEASGGKRASLEDLVTAIHRGAR